MTRITGPGIDLVYACTAGQNNGRITQTIDHRQRRSRTVGATYTTCGKSGLRGGSISNPHHWDYTDPIGGQWECDKDGTIQEGNKMVGVDCDADGPEKAALRPLLNQAFHFAEFDDDFFNDVDAHCAVCWKVIAGPRHLNAEHDGYVTVLRIQYSGFPVMLQYSWVCKECFARHRESSGWTVSSDALPEIPRGVTQQFDAAYKKYLEDRHRDSHEVDNDGERRP